VSLAPPVAHLTSLFLQDIQEKNILLDLDDVSALEAFEKEELTSPSARKVVGDRIVYLSKEIVTSDYGRPVLCDFGEARFGKATYTDDIQPYQYRAPEVILGVPWGQKVDIWSVGVMVRPFFSKSRCTYIWLILLYFLDLEHIREQEYVQDHRRTREQAVESLPPVAHGVTSWSSTSQFSQAKWNGHAVAVLWSRRLVFIISTFCALQLVTDINCCIAFLFSRQLDRCYWSITW
jgi:serine/threonine protein kinase